VPNEYFLSDLLHEFRLKIKDKSDSPQIVTNFVAILESSGEKGTLKNNSENQNGPAPISCVKVIQFKEINMNDGQLFVVLVLFLFTVGCATPHNMEKETEAFIDEVNRNQPDDFAEFSAENSIPVKLPKSGKNLHSKR
jgi:hypothetical protein